MPCTATPSALVPAQRSVAPEGSPLGAVPDEAWLLSPLGAFMTEHRRELARLLKGTPDWDQVARTFAQAGLRDVHGRTPSAETAKETWRRVASAARSRRRSSGH